MRKYQIWIFIDEWILIDKLNAKTYVCRNAYVCSLYNSLAKGILWFLTIIPISIAIKNA